MKSNHSIVLVNFASFTETSLIKLDTLRKKKVIITFYKGIEGL